MKFDRRLAYDIAYMEMAISFSKLSYAERNKVGCIIVSKDYQVIAQGFNGTPKGMENSCEYISESGERITKPEVLHAETNAISKCARWSSSTEGGTLYVTLSPCLDCSKLIIQAGIARVVYLDEYRNIDGLKLLNKAGIIIEQLDIKNKLLKIKNSLNFGK